MGKVYLIGAGPYDEELITLKAIRAIKECTVLLYDRLVNPNILKYANENCEILFCGKETGCHYKTQSEINEKIVNMAKMGHIVGRIKGGDPYVFGRGGEEALRLYEEGIEFEVISGITSAISVLNYGGIPVTHRGLSQSFHVFTGKSAQNLDIDWKLVSRLKGTLVFLMGLENINIIVQNLLNEGMDKNTPCCVIMDGTSSKQKKVVGNLFNIIEKVNEKKLQPPCVIVVGEVVKLNDKLDWYSRKPLYGLNVCITRSKEQCKEITSKLLKLGATVTEINTIRIVETAENLNYYDLHEYDYIVFTSVNGVKIFFDYLVNVKYDIRRIKAKIASIGSATSNEIIKRGLIPFIECEKFVAEDLFESMKKHIKPKDKILIPRSKNARSFLVDSLKGYGCIVDEVAIYKVEEGKILDKGFFNECDVVFFTSPSTVKNLIRMVGIDSIKKKVCFSIGPITYDELCKNGIKSIMCDKYTTDGFIEKLISVYDKNNKCILGGASCIKETED
ncbi:MAG: uroporphyrinogen-III C-methyltransferase [Caloramator sp.]|nr:uroporphyrinogen-III C-methyltransferase [Caloramator sp.]